MDKEQIKQKLQIGIAASFCGIVIGAMIGWQTLTLISVLGFILTAVGIGIIEQDSE